MTAALVEDVVRETIGRELSACFITPDSNGLYTVTAYYHDDDNKKRRVDMFLKVAIVQDVASSEAACEVSENMVRNQLIDV